MQAACSVATTAAQNHIGGDDRRKQDTLTASKKVSLPVWEFLDLKKAGC